MNICSVFHSLTLPESEKHELLPPLKNEKNYLIRFLATFHSNFVYTTSFLDYYFLKWYSGVSYTETQEAFFNIEEYLTRELAILFILFKYEKELPEDQYTEFLRCSFDSFLDEIKKQNIDYNSYIEPVIEDYLTENQDKIVNPIQFIQESNNSEIFAPILTSIAVENDDMNKFKELLEETDVENYYYYITKTVAKTQRMEYLLYILETYGSISNYLYSMRSENDYSMLLTTFTASKIAFGLSDEELVDRVSHYRSGNAYDALRELGIPFELIKSKNTSYIRKWLTSNV